MLDTADGDVIGCVYIYPLRSDNRITDVHSWVRASHAELDKPLYTAVSNWLADDWPLGELTYQARL